MSKIYVAGASKEIERAERAIAWCREDDHTITFDWTVGMRAAFKRSELDAGRQHDSDAGSKAARLEAAVNDTRGVLEADVLWVLVPDKGLYTNGIWAELGIAAALHVLADGLPPQARRFVPRIFASRSSRGQHSIWLHFGTIIEADTIETADAMALAQLEEWQRA